MVPSTFVGRASEIKILIQALMDGANNRGSVIFIEGEAGTGKSYLIQNLEDQARQGLDPKKMRVVQGSCYEDTGGQNAYQPFMEILSSLSKGGRAAAGVGNFIFTILKETGGDWLNMLPGFGPAINASIKTTMIAGQWFMERERKQSGQADALSTQYVKTITKLAPRFAPLVMVIEDAHWIDDASCQLLLRLALKIQSVPLVILVTYRPSYIGETHPLYKTRNELLIKNLVRIMALAGLAEEEIESYVIRRFGNSLNPRLAAWLLYLCKGHPLFITQYLSLLEQDGLIRQVDTQYIFDGSIKYAADQWQLDGRLSTTSVPDSIEALLEQRIIRLSREDQEMLQLGAVQGELFMSAVLAGLLKQAEPDILQRLRQVVRQHHLISLYTGKDFDELHSDVYVFEHMLLQQAFYKKLSPRERVLYHRSVAQQLEQLFQEQKWPARKLILEIAHHYDLGEVPESAAKFYHLAATSLMNDGALVEATEIARRALRNIRQVPNFDRQHAQIVELYWSATEWHNPFEQEQEAEVFALTEQAEEWAGRIDDRALLARLKYLRASHLSNMEARIKIKTEALDFMRQAGDSAGEFLLLSELGQDIRSQDSEAGITMQEEAYKLFQDKLAPLFAELPAGLKLQFFYMQYRLGIANFDRGDYSNALDLLESSTINLRRAQFKDHLVGGLNYLAQTYLAMGRFEQAEAAIREALDIVKEDEAPHDWTPYNLSLLGKVFLEWARPALAVEPMLQAWKRSQNLPNPITALLLTNYYAELLICPAYQDCDLNEADRLLAANIEEAIRTSNLWIAIPALSLRSRIALERNQIGSAVAHSIQAVSYVQKIGTPQAVRMEEILFNHHLVLNAAEREQEGKLYLEQAYQVLQRKANSIRDEAYRKSFLEAVPLSRAIVSAMRVAGNIREGGL